MRVNAMFISDSIFSVCALCKYHDIELILIHMSHQQQMVLMEQKFWPPLCLCYEFVKMWLLHSLWCVSLCLPVVLPPPPPHLFHTLRVVFR